VQKARTGTIRRWFLRDQTCREVKVKVSDIHDLAMLPKLSGKP